MRKWIDPEASWAGGLGVAGLRRPGPGHQPVPDVSRSFTGTKKQAEAAMAVGSAHRGERGSRRAQGTDATTGGWDMHVQPRHSTSMPSSYRPPIEPLPTLWVAYYTNRK